MTPSVARTRRTYYIWMCACMARSKRDNLKENNKKQKWTSMRRDKVCRGIFCGFDAYFDLHFCDRVVAITENVPSVK